MYITTLSNIQYQNNYKYFLTKHFDLVADVQWCIQMLFLKIRKRVLRQPSLKDVNRCAVNNTTSFVDCEGFVFERLTENRSGGIVSCYQISALSKINQNEITTIIYTFQSIARDIYHFSVNFEKSNITPSSLTMDASLKGRIMEKCKNGYIERSIPKTLAIQL